MKIGVVIGRFQPFHNGHKALIEAALAGSDRLLILVGSAGSPRTPKNPFTFEERKSLIEPHLPDDKRFIEIVNLFDYPYDEFRWKCQIESIVDPDPDYDEVTVYGHTKDESSYYLKSFPDWASREVPLLKEAKSASFVRQKWFKTELDSVEMDKVLPKYTRDFLLAFRIDNPSIYQDLVTEQEMVDKYVKSWSKSPFPPTFNAVDVILKAGKNVLLIERGGLPGRGLMALPGGYVDPHETLAQAAVRELKEETSIDYDFRDLGIGRTFDHPQRSTRGRMFTTVFVIDLGDKVEYLPIAKAADDAAACVWTPLNKLKESEMFADHYHIIHEMLNL